MQEFSKDKLNETENFSAITKPSILSFPQDDNDENKVEIKVLLGRSSDAE